MIHLTRRHRPRQRGPHRIPLCRMTGDSKCPCPGPELRPGHRRVMRDGRRERPTNVTTGHRRHLVKRRRRPRDLRSSRRDSAVAPAPGPHDPTHIRCHQSRIRTTMMAKTWQWPRRRKRRRAPRRGRETRVSRTPRAYCPSACRQDAHPQNGLPGILPGSGRDLPLATRHTRSPVVFYRHHTLPDGSEILRGHGCGNTIDTVITAPAELYRRQWPPALSSNRRCLQAMSQPALLRHRRNLPPKQLQPITPGEPFPNT